MESVLRAFFIARIVTISDKTGNNTERQEAVYIIYSMPFASWLAERSPYFDREVQANERS